MEQLTLEQAAIEFAGGRNDPESKTAAQIKYSRIAGFKAGAEWQKEQYKSIREALELGRGYMKLYLKRMGQNPALGPEPGSALDKVNKAIERLQD